MLDGHFPSDGLVDVCVSGNRAAVCNDNYWSEVDAQIVCRQLGFHNGE